MQTSQMLKVLFVEDDPLFAIGLKACLASRAQVTHAASLEQAFEYMAKNPFDLAFIDMDFHGILQGPEIIERAKDNGI